MQINPEAEGSIRRASAGSNSQSAAPYRSLRPRSRRPAAADGPGMALLRRGAPPDELLRRAALRVQAAAGTVTLTRHARAATPAQRREVPPGLASP